VNLETSNYCSWLYKRHNVLDYEMMTLLWKLLQSLIKRKSLECQSQTPFSSQNILPVLE